ncbi:cobalt ECF transporter T component CbiQ [Halodesulfurarchaeum formicicum]|uniref:Cobalt ABC transporter permease n=1 Tax=Halodesulfurarchaeum formicicum TaxID=1873524 RepID=A0A1J1ABF3_9EURY|nr:cobalt ECF transporter T component CbiQ [Halodesulfurarchaeum formicicum]APE95128.1 cobalt ABC transporter permease [Halodesulfurarchaeum formicicum]
MSELTSHVPDPRLLTTYAEQGTGPLHRINAWTKMAVLALAVVAVTIAEGLLTVTAIFVVVLAAYAAAGLPVRRLVAWYTLPFVFVTVIAGPLAFGIPGEPIVAVSHPFGELSITWEGATTYFTLLGRGLTVVTYSLAVWMTTRYADMVHVLGRSLPTPIDQVALFAYRFTFVILEVIEALLKATRARGGSLSENFWANRTLYGRIFGHTFIRALERSETLLKSMQARGYHGDLTVYSQVERPPARELVVVAVLTAAIGWYALTIRYGVIA